MTLTVKIKKIAHLFILKESKAENSYNTGKYYLPIGCDFSLISNKQFELKNGKARF
jgi:hypothetical protein